MIAIKGRIGIKYLTRYTEVPIMFFRIKEVRKREMIGKKNIKAHLRHSDFPKARTTDQNIKVTEKAF